MTGIWITGVLLDGAGVFTYMSEGFAISKSKGKSATMLIYLVRHEKKGTDEDHWIQREVSG